MCVCVHQVLCDTPAASHPPRPNPYAPVSGYNVTAVPRWHQNKLLSLSPRHLAGGPGALLRQPPELTPPLHMQTTHICFSPPPPIPSPGFRLGAKDLDDSSATKTKPKKNLRQTQTLICALAKSRLRKMNGCRTV